MRAVLTDLIVKNAKTGTEIWDMACPTLAIRVGKTKKSWVIKQGTGRVAIGSYPSLSLQEARRRVSDPQGRDADTTFSSLIAEYRRVYLPTIARSTSAEWDRLLTKHFATLTDFEKLTTRDVYRIVEKLKPSEANHAVVALRRMLNWARQTGRIQNRIELKKPNKERSRERVLSIDELARVWKSSDQLGTFGGIVKLLILTSQRRGEIANIHLCKIESAQTELKQKTTLQTNSTVTWHAQHTKNRKEHTIPLTPTAYALTVSLKSSLESQPPYSTWSKPKAALDKLSGVSNWTLHDLRRTAATLMAEQMKVPPHIIEKILGHSMKGVAGIYNRSSYLSEMRDALARWESFVLALPPSKDSTP